MAHSAEPSQARSGSRQFAHGTEERTVTNRSEPWRAVAYNTQFSFFEKKVQSLKAQSFAHATQDLAHATQHSAHATQDFAHIAQDFAHITQEFAHVILDFAHVTEDFAPFR